MMMIISNTVLIISFYKQSKVDIDRWTKTVAAIAIYIMTGKESYNMIDTQAYKYKQLCISLVGIVKRKQTRPFS